MGPRRHRPLDFFGLRRHKKLLRCLPHAYMTLTQTLYKLWPPLSIPPCTSNQTHPKCQDVGNIDKRRNLYMLVLLYIRKLYRGSFDNRIMAFGTRSRLI
jgi:hypothetical protein